MPAFILLLKTFFQIHLESFPFFHEDKNTSRRVGFKAPSEEKTMNENNGKYIILPVLAVAICFTMIFLESAEIVLPSVFRVAMLIAVLILIVIYIALKRHSR